MRALTSTLSHVHFFIQSALHPSPSWSLLQRLTCMDFEYPLASTWMYPIGSPNSGSKEQESKIMVLIPCAVRFQVTCVSWSNIFAPIKMNILCNFIHSWRKRGSFHCQLQHKFQWNLVQLPKGGPPPFPSYPIPPIPVTTEGPSCFQQGRPVTRKMEKWEFTK